MPKEGKAFRLTFVVADADNNADRGFIFRQWTPGMHFGKDTNDFRKYSPGTVNE